MGTNINFTFNKYFLMMGFNDVFHDRKPQARAPIFATSTFINAIKTLKQTWQMLFCDPLAVVCKMNLDCMFINVFKTNFCCPFFLSIFYRIYINNKIYVFLGAWNFYKEIINKENYFYDNSGKFITHIPYPRIIKK